MKKFLSITLALFLILSLASLTACGEDNKPKEATPSDTNAPSENAKNEETEANTEGKSEEKAETGENHPEEIKAFTVGLSISTLDNPFFVDLRDGVEAKAAELGIVVIVTDSQNDSAKEMSNIEDLITRKVDLILINPTDSDAVGNAVLAANAAKIPVITLDRSASEGEVVSHIASDNVAGGKMAGEYLLELIEPLNSIAKVVELEGIPGASATRDRGKGFNEALKGNNTVEVVARQTANFDRTEGLNVMENILQAQPQINAVFAHNDEMALGAIEAIRASGRDIIVIGFDATDDAVKAVKEGTMAATVQQLPKQIGAKGIEAAKEYLEGNKVEPYIPVELQLVKKD